MHFPRTKLVENFAKLFLTDTKQYIALIGDAWVGKTYFIELIKEANIFQDNSIEHIEISDTNELNDIQLSKENISTIIIDSTNLASIDDIRTFIDQKSPDSKVLFTSQSAIQEDDVTMFHIHGISFREYAQAMGSPIDPSLIMQWSSDISRLNELRDAYVLSGMYPMNILYPQEIVENFHKKIAVINQQLFKKEHWTFMEFVRTVATETWELYKEDGIAKMMNISRRKVRKYTELLLNHNILHAIWPFVKNTQTELSRHVKLYWNDLSYYHAAFWDTYYHWEGKKGVIENFVLLELEMKLKDTHEIRFYRKKSGAEIQFVLINKLSSKITPIILSMRSTDVLPQSLISFHASYHDRIEHSMCMNVDLVWQKLIQNHLVTILPHIAI